LTLPCRIRAPVPGDEAGWRRLWQDYLAFYGVAVPPDVTDALWRRILEPREPVHALVAETRLGFFSAGQLVGFANYVLHAHTLGPQPVCYMEDLFVADDARGQGVGRAIIEALIHKGRVEGWPRVTWHTHEANEAARALYDKIVPRDPFIRYKVKLR
jgi:GNAT superfamily N-acetyltransferase